MKATKIVGVVLGVLMVAALSTGAVAALGNNEESIGDVYLNMLYPDDAFYATYGFNISNQTSGWTNVDTGITASFTNDALYPGNYSIIDSATSIEESVLVGTYSKTIGNKTFLVNVKYPSATVTGYVYANSSSTSLIANLIGGTANTDNYVNISVGKANGVQASLAFTNPEDTLSQAKYGSTTGIIPVSTFDDLGVWTVTPAFKNNKDGNFSSVAPDYMYGKAVQFTIISADDDKKLVAASEEVVQGGYAKIILTAPYGYYKIGVDSEGTIPMGQAGLDNVNTDAQKATIHVGTAGEATFVVQAKTTSNMKVYLYNDDGTTVAKQITLTVKAGAITAEVESDSVYIGDEFDIEGTNDLGGTVYIYLKGTNYPLSIYNGTAYPIGASGKSWKVTIDTAKLTSPDAGVYTIYIAKPNPEDPTGAWNKSQIKTDDFDNSSRFVAYTTASISLIQPFITANVENGVVVQGDNLEVTGNAEGNPASVKIYVFGTNFFATANESVVDGAYTFSKKIIAADKDVEDGAWNMATGQYFLVVQHPMYDEKFNIGPLNKSGVSLEKATKEGNFDIKLNENGWYYATGSSVIFNTLDRQSANAAQALIDAIGSQNIDDMQAHLSFIVAGPTSYVNAVPSQVTKGQALTISGTTTGHKNEMVAVELLSTAFAAVPKETVGSAAFATLTTRIGDDGVWSVSFDTSSLNADDYTVSIAVGQLDPVTAKTKIVDGSTPSVEPTTQPTVAPTVKPTAQPTTTPSTPGFGALAALAGLGAVAVLLLRRE